MKNRSYVIEVELEHAEIEVRGLLVENAQWSYPGVASTRDEATKYPDQESAQRAADRFANAVRQAHPESGVAARPIRATSA